jgi:hypothetical protein
MRYQRLGATLIVLIALIFWTTPSPAGAPSPAKEGSFRTPCEIFYRGKAAFVVICKITINATEGHVVELARTPNGKAFVIKNERSNHNEWLLDQEKAVFTSKDKESKFCCKNAEVEICF